MLYLKCSMLGTVTICMKYNHMLLTLSPGDVFILI